MLFVINAAVKDNPCESQEDKTKAKNIIKKCPNTSLAFNYKRGLLVVQKKTSIINYTQQQYAITAMQDGTRKDCQTRFWKQLLT